MITFSKLGNLGRLGNQLFQVASTLGIGRRNGVEVGFPQWRYSKYFEYNLPKFEGQIHKHININDFCFREIKVSDFTDISGYLQSYKFFDNIDIFNTFKLKNEYRDTFKNFDFDNAVSIHVRRGDYLNNTNVYPILTMEYYNTSLDILANHGLKNPIIYIFSDDINWCKSNFKFDNQYFIQDHDDIIELFMMSECENNIISNSTFSWWAASLNKNIDKKVICPAKWFNSNNEILNFVYDDLIPQEWIKNKIN